MTNYRVAFALACHTVKQSDARRCEAHPDRTELVWGFTLLDARQKHLQKALCSLISPKCVCLGSDSVKNECTCVYVKHA